MMRKVNLTVPFRSLQITEPLTKKSQDLNLLQMKNIVGFPKSTIHHILSTFLPYDYVAQNGETRKYGPGI